MRRFATISLAIFSVVLATAMIVRSNQKWEDNADQTMRTLTPDVLISRCGQPAVDIASDANRQMYYPIDGTVGLIFTFAAAASPNWTYSSSHLGVPKGKAVVAIEDDNVHESQSWAIIEMPCLEKPRENIEKTVFSAASKPER